VTRIRPVPDDYPTFARGFIPDGEYPMTIDGRLDRVRLVGGKIRCGNFEAADDKPASPILP
jgi:hypothetical protein